MKTDTYVLACAMRQLSYDIVCEDGVATFAILEASDRLFELSKINTALIIENDRLKADIKNLRDSMNKTLE